MTTVIAIIRIASFSPKPTLHGGNKALAHPRLYLGLCGGLRGNLKARRFRGGHLCARARGTWLNADSTDPIIGQRELVPDMIAVIAFEADGEFSALCQNREEPAFTALDERGLITVVA